MRIAELHIYKKDLPVKDGPYTMSGQTVWSLDTTIVRLVTDTGIEGLGEVCPLGAIYQPSHGEGARAALQTMGTGMIGIECLPLSAHRAMDGALNGHNYAKAAIDIAVYDAWGKSLGLPICDLLGGAVTDRVPSYFATGIGTPNETVRIVKDKVKAGYPRIQLKIGGRDAAIDIEVICKVWEAVGSEVRLAVDANRGLLARDALRISRECKDIPIVLEQPCNTIEEITAIRKQINHAIYLDENTEDLNTVLRVVGAGLCDGFGMKISRMGGLQPMSTLRDICAARSLPHTCDDSWGGDIVAAACTHIGATVNPKLLEGVWLATPYIEGSYDPHNPVMVVDGHVPVPTSAGLGLNIDAEQFGAPITSFGD
jgi:L-alanine-DL-glutamate epimerase-like enolase superfamily enzyme